MWNMLGELADDLGYQVNSEESAFGQKRFDMKWEQQYSHDEIFIEHENDYGGVFRSEIPKLLNSGGKLKVLMTYLPAGKFPGEAIVDKISSGMRLRKAGENFEFLLIFGTVNMESPTDWVGYSFFPTYTVKPLILPSRLPYA